MPQIRYQLTGTMMRLLLAWFLIVSFSPKALCSNFDNARRPISSGTSTLTTRMTRSSTARCTSIGSSTTFCLPLHQKNAVHVLSTNQIPSILLTVTRFRGGGGDNNEYVDTAYGWCMNLGGPAALVAGAVVATLYESMRGGELVVQGKDTRYVKFAKHLTTFLLMTAFAFQIISIFVTTVTGTMLLSRDANAASTATSALGYLREHFEFEYLTARVSFLQGILNWLGAVAVENTIPRQGEGRATIKMKQFVASSIFTLILLLLSFYNAHMTFYSNYFQLVSRWIKIASDRFLWHWPPRPLALLFVPSGILTCALGIRTLSTNNSPSDYIADDN
jgi:hypothetical protein